MFFKTDGEDGVTQRAVLPLLPLRDIIVFPNMVTQLFVGRERSIAALEEAMSRDKLILLSAQRHAKTNDPTADDIFTVGAVGEIRRLLRLPDGTIKVQVEGKHRARISRYVQSSPCFIVEVEALSETQDKGVVSEALLRSVQSTFETYVKLNKKIQPEVLMSVQAIDDGARLGDTIIANLPTVKLTDRQALLEMAEVAPRLERLMEIMQSEIEIMQVEKKIRSRVKRQMERTQKEYYLNEQMQAIQKELGGERDELKGELQELAEAIDNKEMSEEAKERLAKELKKLKMMHPTSAEATVVRNYIDCVLELPWHEKDEERYDIDEAEMILEEDHYGLKKIKERIIEHLAVQALTKQLRGPVLCFVGPPGVGKTSLAKSIARATGRKFVRLSLGGVRDEAEIRGHRRTYIGAMPGKIIQYLKKAGSANPVFLLDEVDKMSSDFRGDPAAALLEVLDREQNHAFNDHYLDLDYDLRDVMFLTTANDLNAIPVPLQDRMEIIELGGYTEFEKLNIAVKYLIKRQRDECGLADIDMSISESAIRTIIHHYTKESGVRSLDRELGSVCRKIARRVLSARAVADKSAGLAEAGDEAAEAENKAGDEAAKAENKAGDEAAKAENKAGDEAAKAEDKAENGAEETAVEASSPEPVQSQPLEAIEINAQDIPRMLGVPKYRLNRKEAQDEVGLVQGLAVTHVGGDTLEVEASVVPGKGKLIITGRLEKGMEESGQAAMSYVRSRLDMLGVSEEWLQTKDVHVHFPEFVRKDGPSAGVTMVTAIVSALMGVPVDRNVAMTGEITLRGRVLPIGGLKEKLLAAHRAGLSTVILPAENRKDLREIPRRVLRLLRLVLVEHVDEVLREALKLDDPEAIFGDRRSRVQFVDGALVADGEAARDLAVSVGEETAGVDVDGADAEDSRPMPPRPSEPAERAPA